VQQTFSQVNDDFLTLLAKNHQLSNEVEAIRVKLSQIEGDKLAKASRNQKHVTTLSIANKNLEKLTSAMGAFKRLTIEPRAQDNSEVARFEAECKLVACCLLQCCRFNAALSAQSRSDCAALSQQFRSYFKAIAR
jgi:ribosomal protein L14E/L6E/L27E